MAVASAAVAEAVSAALEEAPGQAEAQAEAGKKLLSSNRMPGLRPGILFYLLLTHWKPHIHPRATRGSIIIIKIFNIKCRIQVKAPVIQCKSIPRNLQSP